MLQKLKSRNSALYGGLSIVAIWTLLRSFTNGVNFDIVGQIGLTEQWAHGEMTGAQVGATHYLLKMPFYFIVNQFVAIPPLYRITLLALACNLATFFLLFKIYEKVMDLYATKHREWFYFSFLWLAVIAGNLYWVDYANSRNLETVGGLFFVYLVLRYIRYAQLQTVPVLLLTGILVFFADPLQFYTCGLGACLFVILRSLITRRKENVLTAILVTSVTLFAYAIARQLLHTAESVFHISSLVAPRLPVTLTPAYVSDVLGGLIMNTLTIFDANFLKGSSGPVLVRQIINAALLGIMLFAMLRLLRKKDKSVALGLGVTIIIVNYAVYIGSGQVTQWQTARYLVMVPLMLVLVSAVRGESALNKKVQVRAQQVVAGLLAASTLLLLGAFVLSLPNRYNHDQHITATVKYLKKNNFQYALASRETGITTSYFSEGATKVLPMACDSRRMLQPTNLFYDNAAFAGLYSYHKEVPILLDNTGITFGQAVCNQNDIVGQFGAPKRLESVPGVGMVLIYDAASLRMTGIDEIVGHPRLLTKAEAVQLGLRKADYVRPLPLLPKLAGCTMGTIDVVVAHPDDDLLFVNPVLNQKLATYCVRTVFLTAGDAGLASDYWLARQFGIERAYAFMLDAENNWTDTSATIDGQHILVRQLVGHPNVSLMFMRLSDGNVQGQGFSVTGHTSIESLSHSDQSIPAIDGSASYTYQQLTNAIADVFRFDKPLSVYTHIGSGALSEGDHSDHRAVGVMTELARSVAQSTSDLHEFVGYPLNGMASNLSEADTAQKTTVFVSYAENDEIICAGRTRCSIYGTYGRYFSRNYQQVTAATVIPQPIPKKPRPKPHVRREPTTLELLQRK